MVIQSSFLLITLLSIVCAVPRTIHFRQFSRSPSLSGVGETDPFDPNYGSGQFFIDYVRAYTMALDGGVGNELVTFVPDGISWAATPTCSVIKQIGQQPGCVNGSHLATMDAGTQLNPTWGFMFNSGPAFGPNFPDYYEYLTSPTGAGDRSGLQVLQETLDKRGANVKIIPAVGSPRQSSGYLKKDAAIVGLADICMSNWTWRFLPPNQYILDQACTNLVGNAKRIHFVDAVSGLGVAAAVQAGIVTAFEYATAIDNFDARTGGFFPLNGDTELCTAANPQPQCLQNPGHRGLRYIHYPGWQQNWFSAYMYLNMDLWNSFSPEQQSAIMDAGFNSMWDSWNAVSANECNYTQRILDINNGEIQRNLDGSPKDCDPNTPGVQNCSADMKLTEWNCRDLRVIQEANRQWMDSIMGGSPDQLDLAEIVDRYDAFTADIGFVWRREQFPRGCHGSDRVRPVCDCCDCEECDIFEHRRHKQRHHKEHHRKHDDDDHDHDEDDEHHDKEWWWWKMRKVRKDGDHDRDDEHHGGDKDDHHSEPPHHNEEHERPPKHHGDNDRDEDRHHNKPHHENDRDHDRDDRNDERQW